jgi:electron transfer flavoprotein alpha subunit
MDHAEAFTRPVVPDPAAPQTGPHRAAGISPNLYAPRCTSGDHRAVGRVHVGKAIPAINSDAETPIVTRATYAVIGNFCGSS